MLNWRRAETSQCPSTSSDNRHIPPAAPEAPSLTSTVPRLNPGNHPSMLPLCRSYQQTRPALFQSCPGTSHPCSALPRGAASLFLMVPGTLLLCHLSAARFSETFSRCHEPRLHPTTQPQLLSSHHVFWGISYLTKVSQAHPRVKQELRHHPLKNPTCF